MAAAWRSRAACVLLAAIAVSAIAVAVAADDSGTPGQTLSAQAQHNAGMAAFRRLQVGIAVQLRISLVCCPLQSAPVLIIWTLLYTTEVQMRSVMARSSSVVAC